MENYAFIENYDLVVRKIREQSKTFLIQSGVKSVILGVSGGIDSALVAALIFPVCDELGIPLIGLSLPSSTNKNDETDRADNVGIDFCGYFITHDINNIVTAVDESKYLIVHGNSYNQQRERNQTNMEINIRNGNVKARTRMVLLYDMAQLHKGLVLSTDNLTELLLGFWTLHGDVGDFGMIQNLWKTEVYDIAQYLCENELKNTSRGISLKSCIDCNATDGLGITSSDLDQIMPNWNERHETTRSGYKQVDEILQVFLKHGVISKGYEHVIERHKRTEFKRNNPTSISRDKLIQ